MVSLLSVAFLTAGFAEAAEPIVFPKNGQSKEQQEQDQFACYKWAKDQTGFDPMKPVEHTSTAPPQGGAVKGAAKGAAVGAIGGAIAGDAGKGAAIGAGVGGAGGAMRKRKSEKQHAAAEQKAEQQHEASVDGYNRALGACMEGKGYTVK
jgi:hypothetical protein